MMLIKKSIQFIDPLNNMGAMIQEPSHTVCDSEWDGNRWEARLTPKKATEVPRLHMIRGHRH